MMQKFQNAKFLSVTYAKLQKAPSQACTQTFKAEKEIEVLRMSFH